MAWKLVKVIGWVEDEVPGSPGAPTHPIAPGGPPPSVSHPIPPTVWPEPPGGGGGGGGAPPFPAHPIPPTVWPNPPGQGPGNPPGFWGGTPPEWVDTTPPQPQPPGGGGQPPGIWGPTDPRPTPPIYQPPQGGGGGEAPPDLGIWPEPLPPYVDIGGPMPQPPGGLHPMPPIYMPPVIWPDPPEGLPSFDPDQIPQHPDLPDLNHGVWYWVDNNGAMERAFLAQVVRASADLPNYQPKHPPENQQPGDWVIALVNAQRPAWAWIPAEPLGAEPPHADHTLPGEQPHVEHHDKK